MKVLIALCVLVLVGLSLADTKRHARPRRCIYIEGKCFKSCEEGTYSYTVGCAQITPEPTCDEPNPIQQRGHTCDYSACYCNPPTVRDTASSKCVPLDQCPKTPKKE